MPSAPARTESARPLAEIETWIFDLDNTLYPPSCQLFVEVEARMVAFIMAELALDREAADALRRRFFMAHGTTLRGLMLEHGIEPSPCPRYSTAAQPSGSRLRMNSESCRPRT